jgi:hypothetical protein
MADTINPASAKALATWLAQTHPDLFLAVYHLAAFGGTPQTSGLGDIGDFLSSIGSSISDAASSVGSFLTNSDNLKALTGLASTYLNTQSQANVLNAQIARAQASQPPLPVQYTQNSAGQYVPVVPVASNGLVVQPNSSAVAQYVPVTSSMFASSGGSFGALTSYLPYLLGGAVLVGVLLLRR